MIQRAVKKASGGDGENYDEIRYEGYGPGGVAVIVEALTDNRNRAASDIRSYFIDYHEHNFILQVLGRKTIHVFDPLDRAVVSEEALELFHAKLSRDLVSLDDEKQKRAHVFEAGPGTGAYMPTTAGHWVKNGDNVSVSVSFTYYTRATMRRKAAHQANYELRRLGLSPRPVGTSPAADWAKGTILRARLALGRVVSRKPAHESILGGRYAVGS